MRLIALLFLTLTLLSGCQTLLRRTPSFRQWAENSLQQTTHFPTRYTRDIALSPKVTHPFTLLLNNPESAWIDCGEGLILKLKDPTYANQWAELTLVDADNDGIKDLHFTAQTIDTPVPLKAIFLYTDGTWEHYLLPSGF